MSLIIGAFNKSLDAKQAWALDYLKINAILRSTNASPFSLIGSEMRCLVLSH